MAEDVEALVEMTIPLASQKKCRDLDQMAIASSLDATVNNEYTVLRSTVNEAKEEKLMQAKK